MTRCRYCKEKLSLPFILCAECAIATSICLVCFAKGTEDVQHQSNHSYRVIHGKMPIVNSTWDADEDLKMLSGIEMYGLDWELVASHIPGKTDHQCQEHFYTHYVNKPSLKALAVPPINKFNVKTVAETSADEVTEALVEVSSDVVDKKRGDWDYCYQNSAEETFMFGEGGERPIEDIQIGLMQAYRKVQRRRNLLRNMYYEHGDLLLRVPPPVLPSDTPPQTTQPPSSEAFPLKTFLKLTRFLTRKRFDNIRNNCERVHQLRKRVKILQNARKRGIKSNLGIRIFEEKVKEMSCRPRHLKHAHTKKVRDVYYNNNLSTITRKNNVKYWLSNITNSYNMMRLHNSDNNQR